MRIRRILGNGACFLQRQVHSFIRQRVFSKHRGISSVMSNSNFQKPLEILHCLNIISLSYYITSTMARLMRRQSTFTSFSFIYTLLHSGNAQIAGADFFQVQQPQVCQVYTLLDSPVVIETFVPFNTILSHPACGCEITVTNAPTALSTTLTITETLRQEALYTSSTNPPGST